LSLWLLATAIEKPAPKSTNQPESINANAVSQKFQETALTIIMAVMQMATLISKKF